MLALLAANLKIMVRDRQTLFWALAFPLILVTVFGVFEIDGSRSASLAIIDHSPPGNLTSQNLRFNLGRVEYLLVDPREYSEITALNALQEGELEYVLVIPEGIPDRSTSASSEDRNDGKGGASSLDEPMSLTLYVDEDNKMANQLLIDAIQHFVDEEILRLFGRRPLLQVEGREKQTSKAEYYDVLLIGLVGMGMMTNAIIFIAVKISMYRNQAILKRMLVTPLRVRNYFASEILAHLLLSLIQAAVVLSVGVFVFGANIHGNVLWVFVIVAFANTIFLNIGFLISGWANSPRAASGMGNAVAIPMMFFSGTFFPTSTLPSFLPELVQVLPLTPMLEAMREVAIDGVPLWQVWEQLAMLAGWLAVSSVAAMKLFRFR